MQNRVASTLNIWISVYENQLSHFPWNSSRFVSNSLSWLVCDNMTFPPREKWEAISLYAKWVFPSQSRWNHVLLSYGSKSIDFWKNNHVTFLWRIISSSENGCPYCKSREGKFYLFLLEIFLVSVSKIMFINLLLPIKKLLKLDRYAQHGFDKTRPKFRSFYLNSCSNWIPTKIFVTLQVY